MDTDDLSIPTYNGIIIESERFNHNLTLQFGVLASGCKDDDDYLNNSEALIKRWLKYNDFFYLTESILFGEPVNEEEFKQILKKLLSNIAEIRKLQWNNENLKIGVDYWVKKSRFSKKTGCITIL